LRDGLDGSGMRDRKRVRLEIIAEEVIDGFWNLKLNSDVN
jgi:hypothetical protein